MAKKPFNVLSATALAAVLASSAIVPTAVFAAETTQSVQNVIVEHEGEIFELSYEDYTNAKSAGVNFGEVKYVVSSNGKQYKYSDFTQAKPVGSTVDGTLELLEKDPTNVQDVTPGKVIIGEDGKPEYVPPVVNEDFEVTDIAAINETGVTVNFPSSEQDLTDVTVEVKDPSGTVVPVKTIPTIAAGETSVTFEFETALETVTPGDWTVNNVTYKVLTEDEKAVADAVKAAEEAITALPEEITLDEEVVASVEAARALVAVAEGLSEDAVIANIDILEAAEATIADLTAKKLVADTVAAGTVAFTNTSTITVTLDEAVELDTDLFAVTTGAGEDLVTLDSTVTANEDNTVYTIAIADQAGEKVTLSVNGTDVVGNFTAIDKQAAVDAVNTQAGISADTTLAALKAPVLNLTKINDALKDKYKTEISTSLTNTAARIQAAIDRVNAEAAASQQELIDAVNDLTLANKEQDVIDALEAVYSADAVIDSLVFEYFDAIADTTFTTADEIKAVVDQVNNTELEKAVANAEKKSVKDITTTNHDAADTLLDAYKLAYPEADVTAFETRLAEVANQVALNKAVNDVATADSANIVSKLAALKVIDESVTYSDANNVEYAAAFLAAETKPTTVAGVKEIIAQVDAKVVADAKQALIDDVNVASTEDELEAALQALEAAEHIEGYVTADKTAYYTAFDLIEADPEFTTVEQIQTFVNEVNAKVIADAKQALIDDVNVASTEDELEAALQALEAAEHIEGYVTADKTAYYTAFDLIEADPEFTTVEQIQTFVNEVNAKVNLDDATTKVEGLTDAEGELVGDAEAAAAAIAAAQTAVDKLPAGDVKVQLQAGIDAAKDLLYVRDANLINGEGNMRDHLFELSYAPFTNLGVTRATDVAKMIVIDRPEAGFADIAEIKTAIDTAIEEYNALLADVNAATTIVDMQTALQAVATKNGGGISITVAQAETALEQKPETGYKSVSAILAAITPAVPGV